MFMHLLIMLRANGSRCELQVIFPQVRASHSERSERGVLPRVSFFVTVELGSEKAM